MNLQNIPTTLTNLPQWVCAYSDRKCPMNASMDDVASSIDQSTWSTFQQASQAIANGDYDYAGFVFNNNGLVAIDIDIGFDSDGVILESVEETIEDFRSYTELSKSGRGFHIIVKGEIPFKGKNNLQGSEIYCSSRYFIMTGDVFKYDEIIENQEAIDRFITKYFGNIITTEGNTRQKIYTPIWRKPEARRFYLKPSYPPIGDGIRNLSLTSLAGQLRSVGYPKAQIYKELLRCNQQACDPVLSTFEVQTIVRSICRYER